MCGRTACNLCQEDYQKATSYFENGKHLKPQWNNISNDGITFKPSNNIAPTDVTPVLLSGSHFHEFHESSRVLAPMVWGMIPPWHKGTYKSHGLSTNNCRLEGLSTSKLYSPSLKNGKRCVVLCEGFYEWKTTGGKDKKQPYFIYMPQESEVKVELRQSWTHADWSENEGWKGPRLVHLAGLFNTWKSETGEVVYSYSIITMEANKTLSWLHHRMPAILDTDTAVQAWLDFGKILTEEALSVLKPVQKLAWHPVSTLVNNSRNKDENCNKPMKSNSNEQKLKSSFMDSWLKNKGKKKSEENDDEVQEKKPKFD